MSISSVISGRGRFGAGLSLAAILSFALLAACGLKREASGPGQVTQERVIADEARPTQWLTHYGDWRNRQYSGLDQISAGTVGRLSLAWSMDMDTNRGVEATPIVVDGVMYVTGSWSILYAIDARTGKRLWTFDPEVPRDHGPKGCCDVVSRGVAVWQGKVLLATFDGRLIGVDAHTGKPAWTVDTLIDRSQPYTITGAPLVANGVVVIGNGGAEFGVRGYVTAYDAVTGKKLWRFFTVPGDPSKPFENDAMRKAASTWTGEWWRYGGGGTVWDSMAYDPELDLIYLGVGNGSVWNRSLRSPGGGDNLFVSSIVALRRKTGEYVWHFQQVPGDEWDYTATQHMMLLDLPIGGKMRKTIVQAPKNGFFYVLDRATGEFLSGRNYTAVNWTTGLDPRTGRPTFAPGVRYEKKPFAILPGPVGAHNWQPMAFSPQTGLVYIPSLELGATTFGQDKAFRFHKGFTNVGVDFRNFLAPEDDATTDAVAKDLRGDLIAWDPVRQREAWRLRHNGPWNGGVLSTAGGLLFQGTADGRLLAIDARKGKILWQGETQTGVMAAPVSYELDGAQYVSVAVGWGGNFGLEQGAFSRKATGDLPNISRVLTFKLGGTAKLPAGRRLTSDRPPAIPVPASHTPALIDRGRLLFTENCAGCHGGAAVSGGVLPDLRHSSADVHALWKDIVLKGLLLGNGMPNFGTRLTPDEAEAIHAYVLYRARQERLATKEVKQ